MNNKVKNLAFIILAIYTLVLIVFANIFPFYIQGIGYLCIAVVMGIIINKSSKRHNTLTETVIKLECMQEEIEISESRYRELFNNMRSGVAILEVNEEDEKIVLNDMNKAAEEIDDINKQEVLNKELTSVFPGLGRTGLPETLKKVWRTGKSIHIPLILFNDKHIGNWREMYIYRLPSREIVAIYNDLTRSVKTEENLKRFQFLFEHTRELMLFVDVRGNILDANNAAIKAYGYDLDKLWSMNILNLFVSDSLPKHINRIVEEDFVGVLIETVQQRRDGTTFPAEVSFEKSSEDNENLILCIIRDITQHKIALETISHMAYHDALTGLPNRELLNDRLKMAIARTQREKEMFALLSLDLDNFKNVNDTMGHLCGDNLLQKVSKRLSQVVRKMDTVARMGGDEFILLQQQVNKKDDVKVLAEKILKLFEKPFKIDKKELSITTSIGITICPEDSYDSESLLKFADIAMYTAKDHGRNNYQFYNNKLEI